MAISYMYSSSLRRRRSFHRIGIAAACMTTLVGLAFVAAGIVRLNLLEEAHRDIFPIALGIALVGLGVLSITSYAVVRAIEWVSRR
jgi:threonine/homoserine/homoserine lactone efflux protein